MAKTFNIIAGDSELVVQANMDLTGSTIVAAIRPNGSMGPGDERAATSPSPTDGLVSIPTTDLVESIKDLQVRVVTAGGKKVTFPDEGWDTLVVGEYVG